MWEAQSLEENIQQNYDAVLNARRGRNAMSMLPKEYPAAPFYLNRPPVEEGGRRPHTARASVRLPQSQADPRDSQSLKVNVPVGEVEANTKPRDA